MSKRYSDDMEDHLEQLANGADPNKILTERDICGDMNLHISGMSARTPSGTPPVSEDLVDHFSKN